MNELAKITKGKNMETNHTGTKARHLFQCWQGGQLTLEQQGFELHGSAYMWIFVSKFPVLILMSASESTDTEGPLYAWI